MQNRQVMRARKYLYRFDEILDQMSEKMLSQEITDSITINFIKCMIPHHQAAIYMSENLLQFTMYQPLQDIAKNIIKMQTVGIEQMEEVARTTYGFQNMPQDIKMYMDKYLLIAKNMIDRMKSAPRCVNVNLNFVNEMIPHHEGAIAMCQNLTQYRIDPRLRLIADSIVEEQTKGVAEMKEIQKRLCSR